MTAPLGAILCSAGGAGDGEDGVSMSAEDDAARNAISTGSNGTISGRGTTWDVLPTIPPAEHVDHLPQLSQRHSGQLVRSFVQVV